MMLRRNRPVTLPANAARFTGDQQEFKGFAKQLICRGDLVTLLPDLPQKGNEIRAGAPGDIAGLGMV